MKKIEKKLEGIAEKISEILLWECINGEKLDEKVKKIGKKETIFSIYKYNHQNLFERENKIQNYIEKDESDGNSMMMMSLHIPGEYCQFFVNNPHEQSSFCFDVGADTIVLTIGKKLQVILP